MLKEWSDTNEKDLHVPERELQGCDNDWNFTLTRTGGILDCDAEWLRFTFILSQSERDALRNCLITQYTE